MVLVTGDIVAEQEIAPTILRPSLKVKAMHEGQQNLRRKRALRRS